MKTKYAAPLAILLLVLAGFAAVIATTVQAPPPQDLGVNETTAFMYALNGPSSYGYNQNFPSGPETKIPASTPTLDALWKEYFRYFLHYKTSGSPALTGLRIAVGFDFGNEETYSAWKADPASYYAVFDPMVTWAAAAGVHLTPVIMHCTQNTATTWPANRYVTEALRTVHLIEFSRALMLRYDNASSIVMWDLLNEPTPHPGDGTAAWLAALIPQIASATTKPITMGFDAEFVFSQSELTALMLPLDLWEHHVYAGDAFADPGNLNILASWASAAGKPWYLGELGFQGQGYFPAGTTGWLSRGIGPVAAMALWSSGRGPYADYPYLGVLPDYPAPGPAPNTPPVAVFTWTPTSPVVNTPVLFDASASHDTNGTIVRYEWWFGDGEPKRVVQTATTTKTYTTVDTYDVWLTVVDDAGSANSVDHIVTVTGAAPGDVTPPARVLDLRIVLAGRDTLVLRWTASGDDAASGRATSYDLRMNTVSITGANFASSTRITISAPRDSLSDETWIVTGLGANTVYYFALKTGDEVPNWSFLSNVASARTTT